MAGTPKPMSPMANPIVVTTNRDRRTDESGQHRYVARDAPPRTASSRPASSSRRVTRATRLIPSSGRRNITKA